MRGLRLFETTRSRVLRRDPTDAERKLSAKLRGRGLAGHKFVRQQPIGPYFADFLCREALLIVEVDGATHSTAAELVSDSRREEFLREKGYQVLRVTNEDVFTNLDGVCETVLAKIVGS
jgi:very-short-patch-repair endonuclease